MISKINPAMCQTGLFDICWN